jgi:tetratricopeptide (TPR) repeat protein
MGSPSHIFRRYELLEAIGRGGMGNVFRARAGDGRIVALKLLKSEAGPNARARFERERRLQADLGEEEGFVPLLDADIEDEMPYLVLPLLEGGTLREKLEEGPLSIPDAVTLGVALARALGKAHARGIVHRDLKPDNIIFTREGRPLVADLGLAKRWSAAEDAETESPLISQTGTLQGTVRYMAPEQAENAKLAGPPADVFSLGAILYECLGGRPAFPGDSVVEVLRSVLRGAPAEPLARLRPEVPAGLAAIVERALSREPRDRFQDGEDMARALEARGFAKRPIGPRLAAVLAVAVLLAVGVAALFPFLRAKRRAAEVKAAVATGDALLETQARVAIVAFSRALELDPRRAEAFVGRARAHLKAGELAESIADATSAIAIDPRSAAAFEVRASARHESRDFGDALEDATSAVTLDPARARAFVMRAKARLELGQLEGADADAAKALSLDATLVVAWRIRARLAGERGEPSQAIEYATRAIALDPAERETWLVRADAFVARLDLSEALDDCDRAIALDPSAASSFACRASAELEGDDGDAAIEDATKAIELDAKLARPWLVRADARSAQGDRKAASADYQRFLALVPESDPRARRVRELLPRRHREHDDDDDREREHHRRGDREHSERERDDD